MFCHSLPYAKFLVCVPREGSALSPHSPTQLTGARLSFR